MVFNTLKLLAISLAILCLTAGICYAREQPTEGVITVDQTLYKSYPAAFVSLDLGKPIIVPPLKQLRETSIDGDLWVEPRDPEISGIHAGSDFHPKFKDTMVAFDPSYTWEGLTAAPGNIQWQRKLPKSLIVEGGVFLVNSGRGFIYKVRIEELNASKALPKQSRMVLRYKKLD